MTEERKPISLIKNLTLVLYIVIMKVPESSPKSSEIPVSSGSKSKTFKPRHFDPNHNVSSNNPVETLAAAAKARLHSKSAPHSSFVQLAERIAAHLNSENNFVAKMVGGRDDADGTLSEVMAEIYRDATSNTKQQPA